ncbi:MAG: methionine adenosyltransferase [Alphaproteobacteria bacterium]
MVLMMSLVAAESVCIGHPDKFCDVVSDRIVDLVLASDAEAHVAVDCLATTGFVALTGEIDAIDPPSPADLEAIVRDQARRLGHQDGSGFDPDSLEVLCRVTFAKRAKGPDPDRHKADDQGMMFGFACDETEALMPAAIHHCHRLTEWASTMWGQGVRADGKVQATLVIGADGRPARLDQLVMNLQHDPSRLALTDLQNLCRQHALSSLPKDWITSDSKLLLNPKGDKPKGGPDGDCGMTGRKITVDTYGGACPHGGGAFSGKSPGKLDRTGAYAARWIARNIVAAGLARKAMVQLAYVMGQPMPAAIMVESFGTEDSPKLRLAEIVSALVDLRPAALRDRLQLDRPIYEPTAAFGHFGRVAKNGLFPWEQNDLNLS